MYKIYIEKNLELEIKLPFKKNKIQFLENSLL